MDTCKFYKQTAITLFFKLQMHYRSACWEKNSANILKYFPRKIGFENSCKLSPKETIFHEMSKPIFWREKKKKKKKKKKQFVWDRLISAYLTPAILAYKNTF